jgi:hypothetical protein
VRGVSGKVTYERRGSKVGNNVRWEIDPEGLYTERGVCIFICTYILPPAYIGQNKNRVIDA